MLPISLRDANAFVLAHHRHSGQVRGCKFCVAVVDDLDAVHGAGRAPRMSKGAARIAKLMGYQKIITYTLATENGASLRASGWQCAPGLRGGGNWNVPGRPRADSRNTGPKRLYYKELR